ncbi:MAG: DUF368 domain-containing protein [Planctomycetota bacterium]
MNFLKVFAKGMVVGVANIIPGVSGGTMALVMGIYDRLLGGISKSLKPATVREFLGIFRADDRGAAVRKFLKDFDIVFLATLGVGAVAAVGASSKLMEWLLLHHLQPTLGFFFGLVAASIVIPYTLLKRKSVVEIGLFVLLVALTVALAESVSTEDKRAAAEQKRALVEAKEAAKAAEARGETSTAVINADADETERGVIEYALLFVIASVVISAMILPGVSGSFLMLLFGVYFDVLRALSEFDVVFLGVFALGAVFGLAVFSRLLEWLLAKWYSPTMAVLSGLIIGSLWSIWPFQEVIYAGTKPFFIQNILPEAFGAAEMITAGTALAGAAIVIAFCLFGETGDKAPDDAAAVRSKEASAVEG